MSSLTTHVLDTANGCPAAGVAIKLYKLPENEFITEATTNADGRVDYPMLSGDQFQKGRYELVFYTQAYFTAKGHQLSDPAFLDEVVIRFGIADIQAHYHVPLLVSPWSYSTYRGS